VFFYGALFVLVGGLEHVGLLSEFAQLFQKFAQGNILVASVILLWGAGILSAVVDNVALVIALVPVLQRLAQLGLSPEHLTPLWWSLAIGAVLGGLATPIGSSATVVTISLSERTETPIDARRWMTVGIPAWFVGLSLGTLFVVWGILSGFYV
jgi:Na+/H+ antiporter NhaD/arsenite permease-like protein